MNSTVSNQLIEIFPLLDEDFLKGICDSYKEDNVDIDELVEIVLSFEFPPLRDNSENDPIIIIDACNSDTLENKDSPSIEHTPSTDVPSTSQEKAPKINGHPTCKLEQLLVGATSTCLKLKDNVLVDNCDNSALSFQKPKDDFKEKDNDQVNDCDMNAKMNIGYDEVPDKASEDLELTDKESENYSLNTEVSKNILINKDKSGNLNHVVKEDLSDEEDSSPESSIKYLMNENEHCLIESNHLIKNESKSTFSKQNTIKKKNQRELKFSNQNHIHKESCGLNNNSILVIEDSFDQSEKRYPISESCSLSKNKKHVLKSFKINRSKSFNPNQKSSFLRIERKNICQRSSSVTNDQTSLNLSPNHVNSCKIKNNEQRLRRKLLHQNRDLLQKFARDANTYSSPSQYESVDSRYALLRKVFPDADPDYLLNQSNLLTDSDKILTFISINSESRDYPKMEMNYQSSLMEVVEFTIEEFLEAIPDPVAEFSSSNYVRTGYEENTEIYLQARYPALSGELLKNFVKDFHYNLTKICSLLEEDGMQPTPGVLNYTPLHHPASPFFHQEVWFIEHRTEIQNYLDSVIEAVRAEEELNRPPTPPPVEEVFECEICRDEITEYSDLSTCDGRTGHLFCNNCIRRSAEIKVGEGETTFPCLANCGSFIPLQTIRDLLPENLYMKLEERIQEVEITKANIPGVETCPFCPFAYGPGEEPVFRCENPSCLKQSCRICRKENHSPEMCDIFKNEDEETARHLIENRMAEALIRTCYNCHKNFVKTYGCNKMQCSCGAKMCYICRQPVTDYSHFNGQGGSNYDRCPLFSEDEDLHVRPVNEAAEQVFEQLAANNPQLQLDKNKIIPK